MDKEIFEHGLNETKERESRIDYLLSGRDETGQFLMTDPNAPRFIEFDWELLRRNLGEAKDEMGETDFALLAQVMGELLRWIVRDLNPIAIARRAVALAWVMNPEIFKGASTAKLARMLGCHRITLRNETAEASRVFNHRNHAQSHAWNFKGK